MSRHTDFRLPDLGEGLTEAEVVQWRVRPGEQVALNQVLVEVETAKALVEVPSPAAGVVHEIHCAAGDVVPVGAPLVTLDTGADETPDQAAPPEAGARIGEVGANGRTATLVGYGPRSAPVQRRPRTDGRRPSSPDPAPARVSAQQVGAAAAVRAGSAGVRAKPPVRKLARAQGVDLTRLRGSGPDGTVTRADVEAAVAGRAPAAGSPVEGSSVMASPVAASPVAASPVAGSPVDGETRVPVTGVRRATAAAMVASAFTAPQVTVFTTVDVTPTMELRTRVQAMPELAGTRVTPLLFVARALLLALRRSPEMNSTWDEQAQEIVVKQRVHLGIAAATPRGLLVPHVPDAHLLSLVELATALQDLAERARAGRTTPAELTGSTITITNVGAFGVDGGTPLLNPGEAAILCVGAVRPRPWAVDDGAGGQRVEVRQAVQLSLSFDHRIVDGQEASTFLADVGRVLSDPATALVWG